MNGGREWHKCCPSLSLCGGCHKTWAVCLSHGSLNGGGASGGHCCGFFEIVLSWHGSFSNADGLRESGYVSYALRRGGLKIRLGHGGRGRGSASYVRRIQLGFQTYGSSAHDGFLTWYGVYFVSLKSRVWLSVRCSTGGYFFEHIAYRSTPHVSGFGCHGAYWGS